MLDLLFPEVSSRVESQQSRQKKAHDSNTLPVRSFSVNNMVFARNFTGGSPNWLPGCVTKVTGSLSYEIELLSGGIVRRHMDAVRRRDAAVSTTEPEQGISNPFPVDSPSSPYSVPDPPATPPTPQPLRHLQGFRTHQTASVSCCITFLWLCTMFRCLFAPGGGECGRLCIVFLAVHFRILVSHFLVHVSCLDCLFIVLSCALLSLRSSLQS